MAPRLAVSPVDCTLRLFVPTFLQGPTIDWTATNQAGCRVGFLRSHSGAPYGRKARIARDVREASTPRETTMPKTKTKTKTKTRRDIYQEVTDTILGALEGGVVPWRKPWGGVQVLPHNGSTQRAYSGVNVVLLWIAGLDRRYTSSGWMTFRQASALGASVRKGEKGTMVTFWKMLTPKDSDDPKKRIPLLRHYTVFNEEQLEGLEEPTEQPELTAPALLVERSGADVRHGGGRAFYRPLTDYICVPELQHFDGEPAYWSTLLHELAHWTGHKTRLDRDQTGGFGTPDYAKEELVAELSSAFLCAGTGVPADGLQHASYIDNWRQLLNDDPRAIFRAASQARKACEYLELAA